MPGHIDHSGRDKFPPEIVQWREMYVVALGEEVELHCEVNGTYKELIWMKDGHEILFRAAAFDDDDIYNSFTIYDATLESSGSYVCIVWNYDGIDNKTATVTVIRGKLNSTHTHVESDQCGGKVRCGVRDYPCSPTGEEMLQSEDPGRGECPLREIIPLGQGHWTLAFQHLSVGMGSLASQTILSPSDSSRSFPSAGVFGLKHFFACR